MKKLYNTEAILKTHYGDEEFVKSMAELFIEHLPEMSAELQKASTRKDWESLYFYAHKMKATIDLFSIELLTDIIRKLEKQGKSATDSKTLKLKFYNNDFTKKVKITVEGFDAMGKLVHVEKYIGN